MKRCFFVSLLLLMGSTGNSDELPSAGDRPVELTPGASYEVALAAAVAAIEIAAEKRNAWSTSDSLLKQAKTAAADGDEEGAIRMADEARRLAELAIKQAEAEETAWRSRVLSD